jgi:hypothetical protein
MFTAGSLMKKTEDTMPTSAEGITMQKNLNENKNQGKKVLRARHCLENVECDNFG